MDTRARFEEIWPVPAGVYWHDKHGLYMEYGDEDNQLLVYEWNDRLDTFTRCQNATEIHLSLINELVSEFEIERDSQSWSGGKGDNYPCLTKWKRQSNLIERAKQITGREK